MKRNQKMMKVICSALSAVLTASLFAGVVPAYAETDDTTPAPQEMDVLLSAPAEDDFPAVIAPPPVGQVFTTETAPDAEFYWSYNAAKKRLTLDVVGEIPADFDYEKESVPWDDYKESIKSIVLGYGFEKIGNRMFKGYNRLTSVSIPSTVTVLGDEAFYSCKRLESIKLPGELTRIGDNAFGYCRALTEITIPDSVTRIGTYLFDDCDKLEKVKLPKNLKTIPTGMFFSCNALKTVAIPETVTKIQASAFSYCRNLTEIKLPKKLTSIGTYGFESCDMLESITLPNTLVSLGTGAFEFCKNLKSISIPNGVVKISNYAFYCCTSLESVKLPKNLEVIGYDAFGRCSSLSKIAIPQTVTDIQSSAFSSCGFEAITLPENLTQIPSNLFYNCNKLKNLTVPSKVTSIGYYAFAYCSSLETVKLPSGITTIQSGAFYYCSALTALKLPESLAKIDYSTFYGCKSLTSLHIPKNITKINDNFGRCTHLEAFTVDKDNEKYTAVDGVLFNKKCTTLIAFPSGRKGMTFVVPSTVRKLDFYAFHNTRVKAIVVPKSVKTFLGGLDQSQIIITPEGSMAALYAKECKYNYNTPKAFTPYNVWSLRLDPYYSYINIKWDNSKNVDGCIIYKYDTEKKQYVRVTTVYGKSYKVRRENAGKYAVRTFNVDANGNIRYGKAKYITVK